MSRILIVGGGARGRALAGELVAAGHAVRITTRTPAGRAAIEATGAQCWIGTPDRIATLRYALEGVTLVCWLLGNACGPPEAVAELHGSRLEFFCNQVIDTTVRGLIYEGAGSVPIDVLARGRSLVSSATQFNAIPLAVLDADPGDLDAWCSQAQAAVGALLGRNGKRYTGSQS